MVRPILKNRFEQGFTLIELLVVIAIIGVLSSVVLASLNGARSKANDARRLSDLREVQTALELYATDHNGQYPSVDNNWHSKCNAWGGSSDPVISGLSPTYMSQVPTDPQMNASGNTCCYLYTSNGAGYAFMDYSCSTADYSSRPSLYDTYYADWAVYTPGFINP